MEIDQQLIEEKSIKIREIKRKFWDDLHNIVTAHSDKYQSEKNTWIAECLIDYSICFIKENTTESYSKLIRDKVKQEEYYED